MVCADNSAHCTLSLVNGRIGATVQRVGLYILHHRAPFVQPLLNQAVSCDTTAVVLPLTGRDIEAAVKETWLTELGLYTQLV